MKQFFLWAGLLLVLYGALAAGSQMSQAVDRQKVLIAVDVSGSLGDAKQRISDALSFLREKRFTDYKIVTNSPNRELRVISDWSPALNLAAIVKISMYTELPLQRLLEFEEISSADEIIFVTNARDVGILKNIPRSRIVDVR